MRVSQAKKALPAVDREGAFGLLTGDNASLFSESAYTGQYFALEQFE